MWLEQLNALYRYREYLQEADQHRLAHQGRAEEPKRRHFSRLGPLFRTLLARWNVAKAPQAAGAGPQAPTQAS